MQKNLITIFGEGHGLDSKSVDFLTKALAKSNLPGFDYLEFKQALTSLSAMNMDESTAVKSAFATAKTMGLTKTKLVDTARHYKKILDKEKEQFSSAMENQVSKKIDGKKKEVTKLKKQIEAHQAKIKELEGQIKKYQTTIDNADAEIQDSKNRIEETRDNFEHTHQSILNQIEKDIENFNKYL
ncbi:MAG: hypothetical protein HKN16_12770 [Saprospiraceae bacterium]|nr:hypothetical protein [Saprospiraceae bacterium]